MRWPSRPGGRPQSPYVRYPPSQGWPAGDVRPGLGRLPDHARRGHALIRVGVVVLPVVADAEAARSRGRTARACPARPGPAPAARPSSSSSVGPLTPQARALASGGVARRELRRHVVVGVREEGGGAASGRLRRRRRAVQERPALAASSRCPTHVRGRRRAGDWSPRARGARVEQLAGVLQVGLAEHRGQQQVVGHADPLVAVVHRVDRLPSNFST